MAYLRLVGSEAPASPMDREHPATVVAEQLQRADPSIDFETLTEVSHDAREEWQKEGFDNVAKLPLMKAAN